MPRQSRLDTPGVLHHVMIRGIEIRKIFRNDEDRDNLLELVRYIHLNPLRAKMVPGIPELNKYPYSGHSTIMNNTERKLLDVKYVLGYFSKSLSKAIKEYVRFVEEDMEKGRRPELVGGGMIRSLGEWSEVKKNPLKKSERIKGDERILGDSLFITEIIAEANEAFDRRYGLKKKGYDIQFVEKLVLERYGIEKDDIYSGSRKSRISEARSVFCYLCVRELGESMTNMAKRLGVSQPAVGYAVDRGKIISKANDIKLIA